MKMWSWGLLFGVGAFLSACSDVGPGLKNHPIDCAIGIPWSDCLPGTAGYNNGGGSATRAAEAKERQQKVDAEAAEIQKQFDELRAQCDAEFASPDLDPIRTKIEFWAPRDAPKFEVASDQSYPTDAERDALAKYAKIREGCIERFDAVQFIPASTTATGVEYGKTIKAFRKDREARTGALIVALYLRKMTYGEFALKRYEINSAGQAAERDYRNAMMIQDQQRRMQETQILEQRRQATMASWDSFMSSLNSRQPVVIDTSPGFQPSRTLNCISSRGMTTCY